MQPSNVSTDIRLNDSYKGNNLDGDGDGDDLGTETLAELPSNPVSDSAELSNPDGVVCGEGLNLDGGVEGGNLGVKEGSDDMEVDFVENKGSREGLEEVSKDLVEGSEMGSVNVEGIDAGESGSGPGLRASKCEDVGVVEVGNGVGAREVGVKGSSGQASFSSSVQQLFLKSVNCDRVDEKVKVGGADDSVSDREIAVDRNGAVEVIDSFGMVESEGVVCETGVVVCKNENNEVNVSGSMLSGLNYEQENEVATAEIGASVSPDEKIGSEVTEGDSLGDQENQEAGCTMEAGESNKDSREALVSERGLSGPKGSRGGKSKSKGGFSTSDLVWGKVRSHPWWPAQIFEPDDASDQAKKYFRSKSYLVAYFGDQTFAWNEEAKLKPFMPHFSHMVKQSNTEAFRHAVDCALDEIARRVEFGLSCQCIVDDAYSRLKTQVFKNAGIQEKSSTCESKDMKFNALTFEPVKFLASVKNLAQLLHVEEDDRLDHVMTQAQMSAFYRWKGYYHLAEFGHLIGYVNNEADAPVRTEKEEIHEMLAVVLRENEEEGNTRPKKRKNSSSDSGHSTKKAKSLSDLMGKKRKRIGNERDDEETEGKRGRKSILSCSVGRKAAKLSGSESKTVESSPQIMPLRDLKSSFRVGESILRAAGQLSQPSTLLKLDLSSQGKTAKSKGISKQSRKQKEAIPVEDTSPDVILSQLLLTAVETPKEHSLLSSMISFVSDFRNAVAQDFKLVLKHEDSVVGDIASMSEDNTSGSGPEEIAEACSSGDKSQEKAPISGITTTSGFSSVEGDCCAGKLIKVPEWQTFSSGEKMAPVDPEFMEAAAAVAKVDRTVSGSQQHSVPEIVASEGVPLDKDILMEEPPTELTLKFMDMDSIPTEAKLIKIFSTFGPLKESETEVLVKQKCARVVFKRRSDAEAAFSSSGKFETFGASLVCYRLNYAPSPRKAKPSIPEAKPITKDGTPGEGIAT